ncbi:hypothetical protein V1460_23410 [Streptomyces sp. SCSIO 30461]|uniref:hypothetical protein n=1 Tax=Streptomyces sp. SCSIO 30461 TaxID=3118085 RepID=UPI0030D37060
MQTSATLPDLAHTASRPVHWLATATAMAAVVAGAGLLDPGTAKADQSGEGAVAVTTPAAPDPALVELPLECGGAGMEIVRRASGDLDGDGGPETAVVARCVAGSGTPPDGVYVIARSPTGAARVVATLLDPAERLSVSAFAVRDGAVAATLLGYSSPEVPRCCPDEQEQAKWQWRSGRFMESRLPASVAEGV